MKQIAFSFILIFGVTAFAAKPALSLKDQEIVKLIKVTKADQMLTPEGMKYYTKMMVQNSRAKVSEASIDKLVQKLDYDAILLKIAGVYADIFTTEEIQGLNQFYQSAAGQKLIEKQHLLISGITQVTQQEVATAMDSIEKKSVAK